MFKVGFLGLTQKTFQSEKEKVYHKSINSLLELSKKLDFSLIFSNNLIEDKKDLENFLNKLTKEEQIDVIIVQLNTFFSGVLGEEISKISLPLILWALPEPELDNKLKWNSLCALNLMASIIKKYNPNLKFRWIYSNPDSINDLEKSLRALKNIKLLKNLKIGYVVGYAPGFTNLEISPNILKDKLGVEIVYYPSIDEIIEISEKVSKEEIEEEKRKIKEKSSLKVDESWLDKSLRFGLAYLKIAKRDNISAFASRCWPDFSQNLSFFPCFSFALSGEKVPVSCEGDILSSVAMIMLKNLSNQPTTVLDLIYFDDNNMVFWHCGNAPLSLTQDKVELDFHFNHPDKGLVVDGKLKEGEVTIFSFNRELKNSLVFSGKVYYPFKTKFKGTFLYLGNLPTKPQKIFETIIEEGFPHHYTIVFGNYEELIKEIMYWLEIPVLSFNV